MNISKLTHTRIISIKILLFNILFFIISSLIYISVLIFTIIYGGYVNNYEKQISKLSVHITELEKEYLDITDNLPNPENLGFVSIENISYIKNSSPVLTQR